MEKNNQKISSDIQIAEYKEEYQKQVYALVLSIFEIELKDVPSSGYLSDLNAINTVYAGERNCFWVALNEGRVIGIAAIKEDSEKEGLVRRIFVSPAHRSKGVATKLLNTVVTFAKEHQYTKLLFIGNSKMHKARLAMVNFGFEEIEEIKLGEIEIFKLAYKI